MNEVICDRVATTALKCGHDRAEVVHREDVRRVRHGDNRHAVVELDRQHHVPARRGLGDQHRCGPVDRYGREVDELEPHLWPLPTQGPLRWLALVQQVASERFALLDMSASALRMSLGLTWPETTSAWASGGPR